MDGVPGVSFAGIAPGATFDYRFKVNQSGTYWYHAHARFQEQVGLYGSIVIDPRNGERHVRSASTSCSSPTGATSIPRTSTGR